MTERSERGDAIAGVSFVDELLVEADAGGSAAVSGRYDEILGYTVDRHGWPLVELPRAETHEITEVSGERDDPLRDIDLPEIEIDIDIPLPDAPDDLELRDRAAIVYDPH